MQSSPWYSAFYRRGHLLALSIVILLVAGLSALTNLPRLEDPRIDIRNALVITPYPGASAERVEALVTDVLEDELRQLHEVKEIKSTSRAGMSVLSIELQAWVNSQNNQQIFSKIRDALGDATRHFPAGVGEPELDEKRGATAFTLMLAVASNDGDTLSLSIRSRLAAELADRLRNVTGTELVRVYGEREEEIQVEVSPLQMTAAGLRFEQVQQQIAAADPKLPSGVLRNTSENIRLQVAEGLDSVERIRNIPLLSNAQNTMLRLGDIAQVSKGWRQPQQEIATLNGEQVVLVAARMQTNVRVDHWTERAKQVVEQFNHEFSATAKTQLVFEQNQYTQARLGDLTANLLLGCIVVMLVVMLFMGLRASWIVGLSLPLCAAFALFSLSFYGEQIHQMTIFGIIIAIGLLIDNAIVITDEIRIHLQDTGISRLQAFNKAVQHLFAPLLASTLTTILGFMPIFLLPGNIGDFVGPVAISVVMALLGSLLISLTIIAGLAARFLPRYAAQQNKRWYQVGLQMPASTQWFAKWLKKAITQPLRWLAMCIAVPLMGFVLSGQLGNVFFPSADRDQFEIYVWMPKGTAIDRTYQLSQQLTEHLTTYPQVKQVSWLVGGSTPSVYYNQIMNRDNSPEFANGVITLNSVDDAATLIEPLQHALDKQFPQAKIVVKAFGQGPPISAPLGIKVFGPDLQVLNQLGEQIRYQMAQIPGITQSIVSISQGEPELVFETHRDVSQLTHLNLTDIARQLQVALDGIRGGSLLEGTEEIPIRLRLTPDERGDLSQIEALPLFPAGKQQWLPLAAIGEFRLQPSLAGITRINGERVNHVEAFLLPTAPAVDASQQLQALIASGGVTLPPGYRIQLAGDADEQKEALGLLATYAPVLVVMMVTTLILTFSSVRLAAVIGAVAILSVGLGMLSLWISGLPVGFNPILGCAGLIGVAINGSIVVIAAINANEQARHGDIDAIVSETLSCSRHILSTTVTTVGGFVPLLLFSEGSFWPPLAVVLAGGVGFSVILSLVFTPIIVGRIALKKGKHAAHCSTTQTPSSQTQ